MKILTVLAMSILLIGAFITASAQEPRIGQSGGYLTVSTPAPSISQSEKKAFYRLILRNYFRGSVYKNGKPAGVKLSIGSIPAEFLPRLRGVTFSFVSEDETESFRQSDKEIEYYRISGPEYRDGRWYLWIQWISVSRCDGHESLDEFEFRRVGGKWKFRRSLDGVSVSHCAPSPPPPPPPKQPVSPLGT